MKKILGLIFSLCLFGMQCPAEPPPPPEKNTGPEKPAPVAPALKSTEGTRINHRLPPGVTLVAEKNGEIPLRSWVFKNEDFSHAGLRQLREREKLDQVVADGKDEFEKMRRLCDWVNSQWQNSMPDPYPPWDANQILSLIRGGKTGGFCAQYAVVMGQASLSLGWPSRYLDLQAKERDPNRTHFTVELWSNQFNQWIVLDPFFDCYFEREEKPLSALEVHQALVAGQASQIKVIRGQGKNAKTNSSLTDAEIIGLFYHLAVDMRNDHLSNPQHFWDREEGYLAFKDEFTTGLPELYLRITPQAEEFNFALNQVQARLMPGPSPEIILCLIRTNTPGLDTIEIKVGDGEWQRPANPYTLAPGQTSLLGLTLTRQYGSVMTYQWKLNPGDNQLRLRAINRAGVAGPETSFQLRFQPP